MKKIWIVLAVMLVFLLFCSGCGGNSTAPLISKTEVIKEGLAVEVFPGVFDNGRDTVFIDLQGNENEYEVVADFFAKKDAWQKMFPQKKVIAMTAIAAGGTYYNNTDGIIIHYTLEK